MFRARSKEQVFRCTFATTLKYNMCTEDLFGNVLLHMKAGKFARIPRLRAFCWEESAGFLFHASMCMQAFSGLRPCSYIPAYKLHFEVWVDKWVDGQARGW